MLWNLELSWRYNNGANILSEKLKLAVSHAIGARDIELWWNCRIYFNQCLESWLVRREQQRGVHTLWPILPDSIIYQQIRGLRNHHMHLFITSVMLLVINLYSSKNTVNKPYILLWLLYMLLQNFIIKHWKLLDFIKTACTIRFYERITYSKLPF
jgi:hypothetical protein